MTDFLPNYDNQDGNYRKHNITPQFHENIGSYLQSPAGVEILRESLERGELSLSEVDTILNTIDEGCDCEFEDFIAELLIYRDSVKVNLSN